jgi:hypothetical protein
MKQQAVSAENYEYASQLKGVISKAQSAVGNVEMLEEKKQMAVSQEDYGTAKQLKI